MAFKVDSLPCSYLGIPIDQTLRTNGVWKPINERLDHKMDSWKSKWLSWAGRIVMIKATLSAIPIYLMSCISLSMSGYIDIVKKLRDFFWQGRDPSRKFKLISWESI